MGQVFLVIRLQKCAISTRGVMLIMTATLTRSVPEINDQASDYDCKSDKVEPVRGVVLNGTVSFSFQRFHNYKAYEEEQPFRIAIRCSFKVRFR